MYVLEPAADGGNGTFSSVSTTYNKLAATDPGLLHELGQPNWPFDRFECLFSSFAAMHMQFQFLALYFISFYVLGHFTKIETMS